MNLLSNELTKRGWPVSLIPINSSIPDQVLPVSEVFSLNRQWKGSLANTFVAFWKFNKVVSSWKPDVIVLNCDLPELFGALLFGRHNLVVLEHTTQPWAKRKLLGRIVRRILKLRKTTWTAVSTQLIIWPTKEKPSAVLQNSVSIPNQKITQLSEGDIRRLFFIGRLSGEKRPELALEIAKATKLDLVIIGDGIMKNDLEKKARSESIKATFMGWIEYPWSEFQPGDLLIVPSSYEGDGLVVIEGLAHRIPMLLADIVDLRRFNFPEKNYAINLSDFVVRCETFRHNLYDLCLPENISSRILEQRSMKNIATAWENFLNLGK